MASTSPRSPRPSPPITLYTYHPPAMYAFLLSLGFDPDPQRPAWELARGHLRVELVPALSGSGPDPTAAPDPTGSPEHPDYMRAHIMRHELFQLTFADPQAVRNVRATGGAYDISLSEGPAGSWALRVLKDVDGREWRLCG